MIYQYHRSKFIERNVKNYTFSFIDSKHNYRSDLKYYYRQFILRYFPQEKIVFFRFIEILCEYFANQYYALFRDTIYISFPYPVT